ncbi:hypothetical protein LIER_06957 [Lithospermum erythrorhizon]|uniref:BTB domain-containing protein n=1 Tax=Lithospermum erythrorhizon TaxID=34254 RepID=A0AAV3PAQ5_LITER
MNQHHHDEQQEVLDATLPHPPSAWTIILMQKLKDMPNDELETFFIALCSAEFNLATPKQLVSVLLELVQDEAFRKLIVYCGAIPALVRHLSSPLEEQYGSPPVGLPVEAGDLFVEAVSAHTLSRLAALRYQKLIIDAGALPPLVDLLKRTHDGLNSPRMSFLLRGVITSICRLAFENTCIKTIVRVEGGIRPLVKLLWSVDEDVCRVTVWTLAILAMDNVENQNQIISNDSILDRLILMLRSKVPLVQGGVVCLIRILVESYPGIRSQVIDGALQLVIGILSSSSPLSQNQAVKLLDLLVTYSDCMVHIAQRGAIPPLIELLHSSDAQTIHLAAVVLIKLAEDTHNQAGIAALGGILPLLELLDSNVESCRSTAAVALCRLVQNEDTVVEFIEKGGFQKLQDREFGNQIARRCVIYTLKALKKKIHGRVLSHLLHSISVAEGDIRKRVFLALAPLSSPDDYQTIFIDYGGLEFLFNLMKSTNPQHRREGSLGLSKLVDEAILLTPKTGAAQSQVCLGEGYIDNPYVTLLVEGKRFYAHRSRLIESSDAFRAMFEGDYAERNAKETAIPKIRFKVFKLMLRYIYTRTVKVSPIIAYRLLKAADRFLLNGLKRLCENVIAQDITVDTIPILLEFSETFHASFLRRFCILFILEQFDIVRDTTWYAPLIQIILPETRDFLLKTFSREIQDGTRKGVGGPV